MVYTNIIATMKWWYPHTKILKYCSSVNFYEHKNKFGKGWSPGSDIRLGTNTSTLPTLTIELSNHLFVKYYVFEVGFNFPQGGTPIGIIAQYCEHHNITYISQFKNNIPWNHAFPARNRTYFWILGIFIK